MNDERTALDIQLEKAMERAMNDPGMRLLLWNILTEHLYVFDPNYEHNAKAYSLLAKRQAGLNILAWMKAVSPQGTYMAESEYNNLANEQGGENG